MEKRFYLDTSIWIDYVEDRGDGIRPLGEFAFRFLKYCEERDLEILVSDIVILELQKILSKERINEGFFPFEGIIKYIAATPEQHNEAKREWLKANKKIPFYDVLHAVIAKHNDAILVTRDEHFNAICSMLGTEVKKPEDLIYL